MSPVKRLTANERLQLTNLLGALGNGLQGGTAYSIFGDITGEIQDRRERARKQQLLTQQLLLEQQQQAQQDAFEQQRINISLANEQDQMLNDLYNDLLGKTSTHLKQTLDANGNPVAGGSTQFTDITQPISYEQAMGELAARGSTLGMSTEEMDQAGKILASAVPLPDLSGRQEKHLMIGGGLQENRLLDPFWQGLRNEVMKGMEQRRSPAEIKGTLMKIAGEQGYADDFDRINQVISEMMAARGYGEAEGGKGGEYAPGTNPFTIPGGFGEALQGVPDQVSMDAGDALAGPAQWLLGAGASLGALKLGKNAIAAGSRGVFNRLKGGGGGPPVPPLPPGGGSSVEAPERPAYPGPGRPASEPLPEGPASNTLRSLFEASQPRVQAPVNPADILGSLLQEARTSTIQGQAPEDIARIIEQPGVEGPRPYVPAPGGVPSANGGLSPGQQVAESALLPQGAGLGMGIRPSDTFGALAGPLLESLPDAPTTPQQQADQEALRAGHEALWNALDERGKNELAQRALAGDPAWQWVLEFMIRPF